MYGYDLGPARGIPGESVGEKLAADLESTLTNKSARRNACNLLILRRVHFYSDRLRRWPLSPHLRPFKEYGII